VSAAVAVAVGLTGCGGEPGAGEVTAPPTGPNATATNATGPATAGPTETEGPVTLPTETLDGDEELLAAIVDRAEQLGAEIDAEGVRLTALPTDTVPGMRVFRGIYTYRDMRDAVTGIVTDAGEIVAFPIDALERAFAAWLEAGGLPDADTVADVVAFVIGGAGPHEVVHSTDDARRIAGEDADVVVPPRPHDGDPGVVFWGESRGSGSEEVTAYLDDEEFLEVERRPIDDVRG